MRPSVHSERHDVNVSGFFRRFWLRRVHVHVDGHVHVPRGRTATRRTAVGLVILLLGLLPLSALAEPRDTFAMPTPTPTEECARTPHVGLIDGPVTIGAYLGELGAGRRACPRSEIQLGLRGGAIIDTPKFYGALALDATL